MWRQECAHTEESSNHSFVALISFKAVTVDLSAADNKMKNTLNVTCNLKKKKINVFLDPLQDGHTEK